MHISVLSCLTHAAQVDKGLATPAEQGLAAGVHHSVAYATITRVTLIHITVL